ncbi:unnamed protein product [Tilletia controversa]|nr:unnamed protein product [Tilletia controversa]
MLGFDGIPRSVDWSLYGGAEDVAPSQRKYLESVQRHRQGTSTTGDSSSGASSSSSIANTDSEGRGSQTTSPLTSEAEDDMDDDEANVEAATSPKHGSSPSVLRSRRTAQTKSSTTANLTPSAQKDSSTAPPGLHWAPEVLPEPQDASEFLWLLTEEPHRTRRAAILKDHPEIRSLMGHEPLTKYVSLGVTLLQLGLAIAFAHFGVHPLDWRFLVTAYVVGGTANQNTFLAIHEITHNLAFKGIRANKLWAILVNAPIGVPYAMMFKRYHIEHHKHLGEDGVDTDLPTKIELMCLKNVLGKAFFA